MLIQKKCPKCKNRNPDEHCRNYFKCNDTGKISVVISAEEIYNRIRHHTFPYCGCKTMKEHSIDVNSNRLQQFISLEDFNELKKQEQVFISHIARHEEHVLPDEEWVMCKICNKIVKEIYETEEKKYQSKEDFIKEFVGEIEKQAKEHLDYGSAEHDMAGNTLNQLKQLIEGKAR